MSRRDRARQITEARVQIRAVSGNALLPVKPVVGRWSLAVSPYPK